MINCLAVILSLKVSNKKQAENIEKSRINTGFFPMFSNKKMSLGSNGTHGGRVNIRFGQRPDDFIVLAETGCAVLDLQLVACAVSCSLAPGLVRLRL